MKIALVSREYPPYYGGGVGTYTAALARALADEQHTVHVLTESADGAGATTISGRVRIHRLEVPLRASHWIRNMTGFSIEAARRLDELHRAGDIDVAEFPDTEGPAAALAAARAMGATRTPLTVTLHTSSEWMTAMGSMSAITPSSAVALFLLERAGVAGADTLAAPSEYHADAMRAMLDLPEQPAVIHNPLPFVPSDIEPPTGRRALCVGRIEPQKGVESLILAWREVARAVPGAELVLIGRDTRATPRAASMRDRLSALLPADLLATVNMPGPVDPLTLQRMYASAAIVVIPSLRESFSYACAEAMACGRPVVAAEDGPMAELMGDVGCGTLFRTGDPASMAAALISALGESDARHAERGDAGRRRIVSVCDPKLIVKRRIDLYQSTIDRARRCPTSEERAKRLEFWRRARGVGSHGMGAFPAPNLPPALARWVGKDHAA